MQTGGAIPVITLTTVAANCVSVAGGILVFGDPVGADPLASWRVRAAAFAAVIAAAVLMPGPLRGAPAQA